MTLGDVATKARALTHSDTVSYTAANLLIDINIWYQKVASMIFESQDDTDFDDARQTNYPVATRLLVAGQRDYSFSTASWTLIGKEGGGGTASQALLPLKIKRLDVSYDGSNYFRATPFDNGVPSWGIGNPTMEDANMIKQAPRYEVQYNSIFLYPLAIASDVSAGAIMRLEQERNVIPFTSANYTTDPSDSTVVLGFDAPFHPIIAYGAAYEFANANNLPQLQNIKQDLQDWEARLRQAYGRKELDTILSLRPAYDNYGDYGATGSGGYSYGR